jgi:hypothetical protein
LDSPGALTFISANALLSNSALDFLVPISTAQATIQIRRFRRPVCLVAKRSRDGLPC